MDDDLKSASSDLSAVPVASSYSIWNGMELPSPQQHARKFHEMERSLKKKMRNQNMIKTRDQLNLNSKQPKKTYSLEIQESFRNADWMTNLATYKDLKNKASLNFTGTKSMWWRDGTAKTSVTYLLLDPRIIGKLPADAGELDKWMTFVDSIFYVGEGTHSSVYSELDQALILWKKDSKISIVKEIQHILDIWSDKHGVVCLHIFQNIIPAEAYTYEACMMDALGLTNLKERGRYFGNVASWSENEKRKLGVYLLYKAMLIFLSDGERQLRPEDLD